MTYSRRDDNELQIVNIWRRMGRIWIPQDRNAGFDGILIDHERVYIVEIKQPKTGRLTEAEKVCKARIEAMGVPYNIITTLEEAAQLIGLDMI